MGQEGWVSSSVGPAVTVTFTFTLTSNSNIQHHKSQAKHLLCSQPGNTDPLLPRDIT